MCDVLIATAEVSHSATDVDLPGHPPFLFQRFYSSSDTETGPLGWGWKHNLWVSLQHEGDDYRILDGLAGPKTHRRADCDGKKGPRVTFDERSGMARFDFPDRSRLLFARNLRTAGQWLLAERADPHGNWTRSAYEAGRLSAINDSAGRNARLTHEDGLLKTLTVQHRGMEQRLSYHHDHLRRLVRVENPLGNAEEFEYEDNLIVRHVDPTGLSRYFAYDAQRRCVLNWYGDGLKYRRLEFSPDGLTAVLTDSYGYREVYRLNEKGQLVKLIDPIGQQTEWVYAKDGGFLCQILADGTPAFFGTRDLSGRTLTRIDPRGNPVVHHFDEVGRIVTIENALGDTLRFEYDALGDLIALLAPGGSNWRYEYDSRGSLSRLINPKGEWIARREAHGEVRTWDADGSLSVLRFDGVGNLLLDTDPLGRNTRYEYAGQNLLTRMVRPDNSAIRWQYDPVGRITAVTDGLGRETCYEYSPFGSVVRISEPGGRITRVEFDKEENIREIVNGKGEITKLEYDANFRIIKIVFFDGRVDQLGYDPQNRANLYTDARGRITRYTHDGADNPVLIGLPDGGVEHRVYDEVERLVAIIHEPPPGSDTPPREMVYEYNGNNYVTSEVCDDFEVRYEYDPAGNVTAARDSLGREICYRIGRWGQVVGIDDGSRTYGLEYSDAGELLRVRLPNGMGQRMVFDACSRLVRREVLSRGGRILAWRSFEYDAADQLVGMEDWRRGRFRYTYDRGGRLTEVSDGQGRNLERYRYDVEGNIMQGSEYPDSFVETGNRMRRSGPVTHDYDAAGCLVAWDDGSARWELEYGPWDRLSSLRRDGAIVAEYEYDPTGRRTCKSCANEESRFYYHVNNLSTFVSSSRGRWDFLYIPFTFIPLAQAHDDRCYYYSFDQIGTPTEMWDEEENLVACVSSRAYGSGRIVEYPAGDSIPVPFHFLGQYVDDESGLHYNRYRYYAPRMARFLTQDPFGLAAGLNLYVYPTNPMNRVDPLGLAGLTLQISCQPSEPPPFTPCEQAALQQKANQMNKNLTKQNRKTRCTSCRKNKQKEYFQETCGGKVPKGYQVDHIQELQVGGADKCCANLMAIPARPNASCGSQIYHQIKDYGGVIVGAVISPPGCNSAAKCKSGGVRRATKGPKCEEPDPITC